GHAGGMTPKSLSENRRTALWIDRLGEVEGQLDKVSGCHVGLVEVPQDILEGKVQLLGRIVRDATIQRHPDLPGEHEQTLGAVELDLVRVASKRSMDGRWITSPLHEVPAYEPPEPDGRGMDRAPLPRRRSARRRTSTSARAASLFVSHLNAGR